MVKAPVRDDRFVLTLHCPDKAGIVAAVSACLTAAAGFIHTAAQFGDPETNLFFMRVEFSTPNVKAFETPFKSLADSFQMTWKISSTAQKPRVLIMVSKQDHCLNDLLYRWRSNSLPMDVCGVVSNHRDSEDFVQWHKLPFHFIPVSSTTKTQSEQQLRTVIVDAKADLIILARYMQVLSNDFCRDYAGKIINIHHSFLPSFKGAKPYDQAYHRGVKIIGATAHYVTADLDEGPIIEQDIAHVDHSYSAHDLSHVGRNLEMAVLARAVQWHLENRIFMNGQKTVVFR